MTNNTRPLSTPSSRRVNSTLSSQKKFDKRLQKIKDLVTDGYELTDDRAFEFCKNYLKCWRDIVRLKSATASEITGLKVKLMAGDRLKIVLKMLGRIWYYRGLLEFESELKEICTNFWQSWPSLMQVKFSREKTTSEYAVSALLFADCAQSSFYFFQQKQEDKDAFIEALRNQDPRAAVIVLARLFQPQQLTEENKSFILENLIKALAAVKETNAGSFARHGVKSIALFLENGLIPSFATIPASSKKAIYQLCADCFLIPGVFAQVGVQKTRELLDAIHKDRHIWLSVVDKFSKTRGIFAEWLQKSTASVKDNVARDAMQTLVQTLAKDTRQSPDSPDSLNSLHALISVMGVKKNKLSLWARFLVAIRWNAPEPEFNQAQIDQLICSAPIDSAKTLLQRELPHLTAERFLGLMDNPALCKENRTLLLKTFFEAIEDQATLRRAVYAQLHDKCALTVTQWIVQALKDSGCGADFVRFLKVACGNNIFLNTRKNILLSIIMFLQIKSVQHEVPADISGLWNKYKDKKDRGRVQTNFQIPSVDSSKSGPRAISGPESSLITPPTSRTSVAPSPVEEPQVVPLKLVEKTPPPSPSEPGRKYVDQMPRWVKSSSILLPQQAAPCQDPSPELAAGTEYLVGTTPVNGQILLGNS